MKQGCLADEAGLRKTLIPDPDHAGVGSFYQRQRLVSSHVEFLQSDDTLATPLSTTILGAGLMGRLLALALARAGHAVQVFEAGGPEAEGAAARVAEACAQADLVVVSVPVEVVPEGCLLLDPERLRGSGTLALYPTDGGLRVVPTFGARRVWSCTVSSPRFLSPRPA